MNHDLLQLCVAPWTRSGPAAVQYRIILLGPAVVHLPHHSAWTRSGPATVQLRMLLGPAVVRLPHSDRSFCSPSPV